MLVSLPYWIYQMLRHGKYRRGFAARMGEVPARLQGISSPVIWVHAVSVGEVLAVAGLVEDMKKSLPGHRVMVSTTTDTGQELARKRFGEGNVFYFPMDFAFAIRPYLRCLKPELVVLAETEFWPNFLHQARISGARIAVANARISDQSWPNYRRFRVALRKILAHVDLFLAQTSDDAARLESIGAPAGRVQVTGNLKFDVKVTAAPAIVEKLRTSLAADGAGPVLLCGSTVDGEEPLLLQAFAQVRGVHLKAVMILAPRHPERFPDVALVLEQQKIAFHRRSQWDGEALAGGVLLLDTIGELAALYALADVAFVGGSLVPRGGHNIIEPAQHGAAIVVGEYTENFRDIVGLFRKQNAVVIASVAELPQTLLRLLADDAGRRELGRRAQETVRAQAGATARTVAALRCLIAEESESPTISAPAAHTD